MQVTRPISLFERLELEIHSHCNRSCWFCPRTYDRSGLYGDEHGRPVIRQMPTEKVIDILDQAEAIGFNGLVCFFIYSESLLDKRSPMFANAARKRRMQPILHTNGDMLKTNPSLISQIQKQYLSIVIGLYDYLSNEELAQEKRDWGKLFPENQLKFSYIGDERAINVNSMVIPRAKVPTRQRIRMPDLTYEHGPCRRPLIRMMIRYDGEMMNCCEDIHAQFGLGNVFQQSLEELWFSTKHVKLVNDLVAGNRQKYALCSMCPLSPSGPSPSGKKIRIKPRHYQIT